MSNCARSCHWKVSISIIIIIIIITIIIIHHHHHHHHHYHSSSSSSSPSPHRYRCHFGPQARAGLFVTEVKDRKSRFNVLLYLKVDGESEEDMQCHCSVLHNSVVTSTSSRIRLRFVVEGMRPDQVTIVIIA